MIEAIVAGTEPAGSAAFVHIFDISTSTSSGVVSPGTGIRNVNSGTGTSVLAISYVNSISQVTIQLIPTSVNRTYTCGLQVVVADSRRQDIYIRTNATDYGSPQSGQRVRAQTSSNGMTLPGGELPVSAAWFATTISGRTKFWLYHDGSATVGSNIQLRKLRLLRKVNGSL
jgi:hypothetical protein